jgi:hypothetical protein
MVIFHSYVSLPEGNIWIIWIININSNIEPVSWIAMNAILNTPIWAGDPTAELV